MLKMTHKYVRRVIRWVQTPSAEDEALHERAVDDLRRRRRKLRIRNMMRGRYHAVSVDLLGLTKPELVECFDLIVAVWREDGDIPASHASGAFAAICEGSRVSYPNLIKEGLIPAWPFSSSSGEVAA